MEEDPIRVKFKAIVNATGLEEIIEYNDICSFIEEQEKRKDGTWRFKKILEHRKQKGQYYQVLIEWESLGRRAYLGTNKGDIQSTSILPHQLCKGA